MPYRQFTDPDGATWDVWEVRPAAAEEALRKARADRHKDGADWRSVAPVNRALAAGWLCFESGPRKRRLAPIPSDWVDATPEMLLSLCGQATAVSRVRSSERPGPPPELERSAS